MRERSFKQSRDREGAVAQERKNRFLTGAALLDVGGRRNRRISFPRVSRRPAAPSRRCTRGYSPSLLRSEIEHAELADSVTNPAPPTVNTNGNLYLRLVYEYDDTAGTRRRR